MPSRAKRRSKLLLTLMLAVALVQGAVPLSNERVRRLGDMMKCKCGCQASITGCNMISCHFADPARTQLLQMVEAGRTDEQVFAEMQSLYGKEIMLKPSTEGFYLMSWLMPFIVLAGGLGLLYLVLQSYIRRRPVGPSPGVEAVVVESPELAQYKSRIDKDLSDLE